MASSNRVTLAYHRISQADNTKSLLETSPSDFESRICTTLRCGHTNPVTQ